MTMHLPIGQALRRFRRLHSIKQAHLAEMMGVSQGSVSRWESATHEPDTAQRERLLAMIAARTSGAGDAALKRLIASSRCRVHLICDATHRLLAASPARAASWRTDVTPHLGLSLWRYASDEIIAAQDGLAERGWFASPSQSMKFYTSGNDSETIVIHAGMMRWETIMLADGRVGRLTTALD